MITDSHTNVLYLAGTLPKRYPEFFNKFIELLAKEYITPAILPQTKDIWAVDYMPIQLKDDRYIKFHYNPDYLRSTKKWSKTISDGEAICLQIGIEPETSKILIDGGNVVKYKNQAIMTTKVFLENPDWDEKELRNKLHKLLEVDKIIFIPIENHDIIGHADGVVRYLDQYTVLLNDAPKDDQYYLTIREILRSAGIQYIPFPLNIESNKTALDATGIYINFLQMTGYIFLPVFNNKADEKAIKISEECFSGSKVIPVRCNDLALEGGLLNCISWNIFKKPVKSSIDRLIPIYGKDSVIVVLDRDIQNSKIDGDILCIKLNIDGTEIHVPHSLELHLKWGMFEPIAEIEREQIMNSIKNNIPASEIEYMVHTLEHPSKKSLESLVR